MATGCSFIFEINSVRSMLAMAGGFICQLWLWNQPHWENLTQTSF